jgi:hypothetical protein
MDLEDLDIVGHFPSKRMGGQTLKSWTMENFGAMLGYLPCGMVLVKGWVVGFSISQVTWKIFFRIDGSHGVPSACVSQNGTWILMLAHPTSTIF